jgi:hypothetical protein
MPLERDRKREWITLQVVNCLLETIREQNGVPCDDSNGGVTEEVEAKTMESEIIRAEEDAEKA